MTPERPVTDLCINEAKVHLYFTIDVNHKVIEMKTISYEMYNWVAMYGKFYSHLSQDVNRPVKNGSWSAEIKLLKDTR